jgi:Bacterial Ig domain
MQLQIAILTALVVTLPLAQANAQNAPCKVAREAFVQGGVAKATMILDQDGVCGLKFNFGGRRPPDSWELVQAPSEGTVVFNGDSAEYKPKAGFFGPDKFLVAVFGIAPGCAKYCARNGRYEVTVSVQPKT